METVRPIKLSEFIKELQDFYEIHGDIAVNSCVNITGRVLESINSPITKDDLRISQSGLSLDIPLKIKVFSKYFEPEFDVILS